MIFEIVAEKFGEEGKKTFYYDNMKNVLTNADGVPYEFSEIQANPHAKNYVGFNSENPIGKSKSIRQLKIQLGLSCNYSCDYCSQKFVGWGDSLHRSGMYSPTISRCCSKNMGVRYCGIFTDRFSDSYQN